MSRSPHARSRPVLLLLLLLVLSLGVASSGWVVADDASTYKVRSGDTLARIANKTGCSIAALRRANRKVKDDIIHPGDRLRLPKGCRGGGDGDEDTPAARSDRYKVQGGDTLGEIARKQGCSVDAIKRANRMKNDVIHPGDVLKLPTSCAPTNTGYKVQGGDTLGKIAKKHGCSVDEVKRANGMKNDVIQPGMRLKIPSCVIRTGGKPRSWKGVNQRLLPRLMKDHGFTAPPGFKAMIVEISFNRSRKTVTRERVLDYNGTSDDRVGWNPASTVKLFAAISAVQRIRSMGFSPAAKVTFHSPKKTDTYTIRGLIEETLTHSNNITYNRLVQLASFDLINGQFLNAKNGLPDSAIVGAYERENWTTMGESPNLRHAPEITLKEGKRTHKIPASRGSSRVKCASSACTTPRDLAEGMRRLMLQEQLPARETYRLQKSDLKLIRKAMKSPPKRPNDVLRIFSSEFKDKRVVFFSKAGFSRGWFTNNFYIYDPTARQAWIVVMTSSGGHDSLNDAARIIAKIIASGELRRH